MGLTVSILSLADDPGNGGKKGEQMSTSFYKTTIQFEVLHDEDLPTSEMDLLEIVQETITGHASGAIMQQDTVELTKEQAAQALVAQGSDPHFLDMEE